MKFKSQEKPFHNYSNFTYAYLKINDIVYFLFYTQIISFDINFKGECAKNNPNIYFKPKSSSHIQSSAKLRVVKVLFNSYDQTKNQKIIIRLCHS